MQVVSHLGCLTVSKIKAIIKAFLFYIYIVKYQRSHTTQCMPFRVPVASYLEQMCMCLFSADKSHGFDGCTAIQNYHTRYVCMGCPTRRTSAKRAPFVFYFLLEKSIYNESGESRVFCCGCGCVIVRV